MENFLCCGYWIVLNLKFSHHLIPRKNISSPPMHIVGHLPGKLNRNKIPEKLNKYRCLTAMQSIACNVIKYLVCIWKWVCMFYGFLITQPTKPCWVLYFFSKFNPRTTISCKGKVGWQAGLSSWLSLTLGRGGHEPVSKHRKVRPRKAQLQLVIKLSQA